MILGIKQAKAEIPQDGRDRIKLIQKEMAAFMNFGSDDDESSVSEAKDAEFKKSEDKKPQLEDFPKDDVEVVVEDLDIASEKEELNPENATIEKEESVNNI